MQTKNKTTSIPSKIQMRDAEIVNGLISSCRIENIHISQMEAFTIYAKVKDRLQKERQ